MQKHLLTVTNYLLALSLFFGGEVMAQSQEMAFRMPTLSPDGQTVAFSFQGDIWTVGVNGGDARRLTIHEAYESDPKWSPNGDRIAFSSNRFGNNDIFVIPAKGGVPTRLTYHSGNDVVESWTADDHILFTTMREYNQIEWEKEIYQVSAKGNATESRAMNAFGNMPKASPNGKMIAFVKGPCRTAREDYRGPANRELWIYHKNSKKYLRITNFDGNDFMPAWGNDQTLYYISAKSGRYNIYQQAIASDGNTQGEAKMITNFKDYGVQHFDVGNGGSTIVYERFGKVFTMLTAGGAAKSLAISVANDYRFDPIEHQTYSNNIDEYAVSPNGKLLVLAIRGEIFVKEADKEKPRSVNISNNPYRDHSPVWANDSTVVFVSDRDGGKNLYMVRSSDNSQTNIFKSLKHEVKQLTTGKEYVQSPIASPNGKMLSFRKGNSYGPSTFIIADIDTKAGKLSNERVFSDGWATVNGLAWSPDSRWIAYSMPDLTFNSDIFVMPVDRTASPINISMHPRGDYSPMWSADGRKLAFVSERNDGNDVWFAWLRQEDWEKTQEDWEEVEEVEKKDKKEKDAEPEPVVIDADNIHYRLTRVTAFPGNEGNPIIANDGETIYFTGQSNSESPGSDLYSVKWDGKDLKQLTQGNSNPGNLSITKDGSHIYYVKKGSISRCDTKSGKSEGMPHKAYMAIDHPKERKQIFDEAWTAINLGFYDPKYHGQDLERLKKDFESVCMTSSNKTDFRYYFNLMLGQLNASHMGLYGSDREETQRERTGLLGTELKPVAKGVEVTKVVMEAPAYKKVSRLMKGDIITHVDGMAVAGQNFHSLMVNKAGVKTLLTVERNGASMEVVIRPDASLGKELYNEWVAEKKMLVDKYSDGKLGYIHIEGMNWPSFERFEREMMASGVGKQGIVIDVRYNGGGWTTDYLMALLNVKQHAYTIPRGAAKSLDEHKKFKEYYPFGERLPFGIWNKPSIALCNEASYSNAEIFAHAYKTLGIGKLVGIQTFGAVISTGASYMVDGSRVRMPFRAWFVKKTEKNMENEGAMPDIVIDNAPGAKSSGEDLQLKKAVDELLKDMK